MSNNNAEGEFMRTADDVTYMLKSLLSLLVMLIWFVMTAGPYMAYASLRDAIFRASHENNVWIVEQNPAIAWGHVLPPQDMTDAEGTGAPIQNYYARVGSVREAEDWMLRKGYRKTTLHTERVGPQRNNEKTFPVKHIDDTKMYSVLALMIDYGDGKVMIAPYSYPSGSGPINFKRFEEETFSATFGRDNTAMPRLLWLSSDGSSKQVQTNDISDEYVKQYVDRTLGTPQPNFLIDFGRR